MSILNDKRCKQKIFTYPSGKIIKCQGYEPFALTNLLNKYNEEQIVTIKNKSTQNQTVIIMKYGYMIIKEI